ALICGAHIERLQGKACSRTIGFPDPHSSYPRERPFTWMRIVIRSFRWLRRRRLGLRQPFTSVYYSCCTDDTASFGRPYLEWQHVFEQKAQPCLLWQSGKYVAMCYHIPTT